MPKSELDNRYPELYRIAVKRIEKVINSHATMLDLSGLSLIDLPPEILNIRKLKLLDLDANQLSTLPSWFSELKSIEELKLDNNNFSELPKNKCFHGLNELRVFKANYNRIAFLTNELETNTKLEILQLSSNALIDIPETFNSGEELLEIHISRNKFEFIPDWVMNLEKLQVLKISGNNISYFPQNLSNLKNLETLDASHNSLNELAEYFDNLEELRILDLASNNIQRILFNFSYLNKLEELFLDNNNLTGIPDSILNLKNLKTLCLNRNYLKVFPDAKTAFPNLEYLYAHNNNLAYLPEWIWNLEKLILIDISNNKISEFIGFRYSSIPLKEIIIRNNEISSIPSDIVKLPSLISLKASGCPLNNPPLEVVEQGLLAIQEYFKQKEVGTDKLYEAKLMIVGEAGAGKTSLALKLLDPCCELPEEDETTRGIDIRRWNFSFDGNEYKANIWDFGGQEIYHATHQFFLSKRAVYVLLADSRKDNTDYFDWLHRIRLFAGDSPVVIVHNEKDDRLREINMSQINQRFPGLTMPMRCNLADLRGYVEIVDRLKYEISQLDLIGITLPKTWMNVREKIMEMVDKGSNYIPLYQFFEMCEGFDEQGAIVLSQYLHDIGVVLHFQDDPILYHTVIIDPEWGTQAVYKAIDTPSVTQNQGRFSNEDLAVFWSEEQYQYKYHELLQLMKNFQLCYEIPSEPGRYILPQLLPFQPADYEWDGDKNLIVEYRYSYLLKSIMIRFIINSHDLIEDHLKTVWQNGVVLKNSSYGARAEIISDEDLRVIRIKVSGSFKSDFLAIIMDRMEKVHKAYKNIDFEIMVPCNCESCKNSNQPNLYRLSNLRERVNNNKPTVECNKHPYHEVEILPLISDSIGLKWVNEDESDQERLKDYINQAEQRKTELDQGKKEIKNDANEFGKPPDDEELKQPNTKMVVFFLLALIGGILSFLGFLWAIKQIQADPTTLSIGVGVFSFIVLAVLLVIGLLNGDQFIDGIKAFISLLPTLNDNSKNTAKSIHKKGQKK